MNRDPGRVLLVCEDAAQDIITAAQEPTVKPVTIEEAAREAALGLLTDPQAGRPHRGGLRGGRNCRNPDNLPVGYLAAVSRKLPKPLAVIVQFTSAAGKSTLLLRSDLERAAVVE